MEIIRKLDRTNVIIAGVVWFTAFFIYNLTKAPTFSLWDCGEFIAASSILGIPHPPGTPFYIILGRIFSILPIAADVAVRINLLSVISSAFAAMFAYLAAVKILKASLKDNSLFGKVITYAGSVCGSFFLAFSLTNWNNSVEAEVYGLSMMIFTAIFWLVLIYHENREKAWADKLIVLIIYLAFLGINAHLATYLVIPCILFFFIFKKDSSLNIWYMMGGLVMLSLYLIFAMSSKPDEIAFYIPLLIVFIFYLFYIFSFEKILVHYLITAGVFVLAILPIIGLGFDSSVESTQSIITNLQYAGKAGFALLLAYGGWLLYKFSKAKKEEDIKQHYLMASIFIIVGSMMVLMLYLKGYSLFMLIAATILFVLLYFIRKSVNWTYFIAIGCVSLVMIGVEPFLIGVVAGLVIITLGGLFFKLPNWKNGLLIILVAVLGHSINIYTPVRSELNPNINENDPSQSYTALVNFIERKQYGSVSMTERMFKRRAEWKNQFGDYQRMGFWRFFKEQYGINGVQFLFPFIIGIFGIWETLRRRGKIGIALFLIIIISSVGLVLYMNFSDGSTQTVPGRDHLEVRDRDYFFTPAFMFFGLAIGLGITYIVQLLKKSVDSFNPIIKKVVIASSFVLFLLPAYTVSGNYFYADRSNNYIPYDYAHNIVDTVEKNAILFTAADNDTFSLWCIQEAYNERRDIAVVNTALSNLEWYIRQLRDNLGIKLSWTDEQIRALRPFRDQRGITYSISAQVMNEVIKENINRRPIYFSVTVPSSQRVFMGRSVDSSLSLYGFNYRLTRQRDGVRIALDSTFTFLTNPDKFRYRSIADKNVHKDDASLRITRNYTNGFMQLSNALREEGQIEKALLVMEKCVANIPHASKAVNYLGEFYVELNKDDEMGELIDKTEIADKQQLYLMRVKGLLANRKYDKAEIVIKDILLEDQENQIMFESLIRVYANKERPDKIIEIVSQWLVEHPDDLRMQTVLRTAREQLIIKDSLK